MKFRVCTHRRCQEALCSIIMRHASVSKALPADKDMSTHSGPVSGLLKKFTKLSTTKSGKIYFF